MRADRDSGGGVARISSGGRGFRRRLAVALTAAASLTNGAIWAIGAIGAIGASGAAGGSATADDPVLARIDFEDRETATASWSHVFEQAPGLPRRSLFFDAVVDETVASAGGSSLRLHLEGGSISYRMRPEAAIPVRVDADHRVSARVRTAGLRYATARLEIRVVDGRRLDAGTEAGASGDPVADATIALLHAEPPADRAEGRWVELAASVRTEGAAFQDLDDLRLFIALQVVQPGFDDPGEVDAGGLPTLQLEDIDGRAWFDEIEVRRSPRLRVTPVAESGIRRGDGPIDVEVVVDDPTGRVAAADVELRAADGRTVDRRDVPVDRPDTQRVALTPDGPGWFEVILRTRDRDGRAATRRHAVLVLPESDRRAGREAPRFGVSVARWTPESLDALQRTLDLLDPDAVELPIWPAENDGRASLEGVERVRRLLDRQRRAGREPMVAVDRLHGGLADTARVEPHAVRAALEEDADDLWRRAIGDWMQRLGTAISRWRVDGGPIPSGPPALFTELAAAFVADPVVLVTAPFDRPDASWGGDESCRLGTEDLGSGAQAELSRVDPAGATVLLSPPPTDWSVQARIDDAARRGLVAWRRGAERVLLRWDPFAAPDPALLAWSGLARAIGSRRPVGEVRTSDTSTCLVADDGFDPAIIAWSELEAGNRAGTRSGTRSGTETLRIPVGVESVEVLELDGRRRRVDTSGGLLDLDVGSTPRVVLGADRLPAMLAASARFEPATLELGHRSHTVELVLRNPVADPLDGEVRFDPPPGWTIEPARPRVRASGGETIRIPLTVSWSGPQALGPIDVPVRLDVRSPRPMRIPITVPLVLESDALMVVADWSIAKGGPADSSPIILTVEIENIGDRSLDLELAVSAWRVSRERRTITELRPGEREVRRLRIPAGLDRLAGTELRVEVRELDGPESLALKVPLGGDAGIATAVVAPTP